MRYAQYVADTGVTDSWELDALTPTFIDALVDQAISDLVDQDAWGEALADEQTNRGRLHRLARHRAGRRQ